MSWRRILALLGTLVLLLTAFPVAAAQPPAASESQAAPLDRSTASDTAALPAPFAGQVGPSAAHSLGGEGRGPLASNDALNRTVGMLASVDVAGHFVTPTARFDDSSPACLGTEMIFTNTSTPGVPPPTTYLWDFGDGITSTVTNPTHVYAAVGAYTATLTACNVKNMCDTAADVVEVQFVLVAGFAFAVVQTTVVFTDTSQNATSYLWDFGDGITDTVANPIHTYAAPGTYTVTQWVFNDCGSDITTSPVTVGYAPVAGFSSNSPVCLGLPMLFTNTTAGALPISYLWAFGDGGTSTNTNPIHLYAAAGPYTVTLDASNAFGSDQALAQVEVLPLPASAFTYTMNAAVVTFTNLSQNATAYLWDFGDGITDTAPNPVHTYAIPGTYTVTLRAVSACGSAPSSRALHLTWCVNASIISTTAQVLGCGVSFRANLAGDPPFTYLWDFGAFGTSTETNPIVDFGATGTYSVTLDVWNCAGNGHDAVTFPVSVDCGRTYLLYLPLAYKAHAP